MRIFNRYYSLYDILLILGDLVLVVFLSTAVRASTVILSSAPHFQWTVWTNHGMIMALLVTAAFYYADLYSIDQTLSVRELLVRFMSGFGLACIIIGMVSYPLPRFGKAVYLSEMFFLGIGLCIWRVGFRQMMEKGRNHAKILVVGVQNIGKLVAEELLKQKKLGMEVVGFAGDVSGQLMLSYGNPKRVSLPIFPPQSLTAFVEERKIERILLAGGGLCAQSVANDLVRLRTVGITVEDCHSFYERLASKIAVADLSPEWIALSGGFNRDRLVLAAKRVIDIVMSSVALIVSAPLLLLTAIAIKFESPGTVLYRQERIGQNDKPFTLYKFRSMSEHAEASGPVWAAKNDPRVTRVGAIIRKLRIDEIPQMINVLKGEMSFVGPRPERAFFVNQLKEKIRYYDLRHSVKPGITGWAQISYSYGDSEQDAIEKLQYDLYYIKHMSPFFDLQIIFESLKVILLGKGAR